MKFKLLFLLLMLFSIYSFGQATPEKIISDFFKTYSKNEPDKAIDELYTYSPWLNSEDEVIVKLKSQFRELQDLIGGYNGYQLLSEKSFADCFEVYVYLVKFDRQPFRFVFEFYKPKDTWITYSFSYDYDLDGDFEKAVNLELFNNKK